MNTLLKNAPVLLVFLTLAAFGWIWLAMSRMSPCVGAFFVLAQVYSSFASAQPKPSDSIFLVMSSA